MSAFGNTCPCLKIAQHYGVDYSIPLLVTDYFLRGAKLPDGYVLRGAPKATATMGR